MMFAGWPPTPMTLAGTHGQRQHAGPHPELLLAETSHEALNGMARVAGGDLHGSSEEGAEASPRTHGQLKVEQLQPGLPMHPSMTATDERAVESPMTGSRTSTNEARMEHSHGLHFQDVPAPYTPVQSTQGCMHLPSQQPTPAQASSSPTWDLRDGMDQKGNMQHSLSQSPTSSSWDRRGERLPQSGRQSSPRQSPASNSWDHRGEKSGQDAVTLMAPMPVDPLTPWGEAVPGVDIGAEQVRGPQDHKLRDIGSPTGAAQLSAQASSPGAAQLNTQASPPGTAQLSVQASSQQPACASSSAAQQSPQENAAAAANAASPHTPSSPSPQPHTPMTRSQVWVLQ